MAVVANITSLLDDSGFKKAEKAFAQVGQAAAKTAEPLSKFGQMQEKAADAAAKAQQKVNQASVNLINAKSAEAKAAANVMSAEQKLAAAREQYGDDSKQALEAEKRLEAAKLQHESASVKTKISEQRLSDAQRESERASKDLADAQNKTADVVDKYEGEVKQAERATGEFSNKMGTLGKIAAGAAIVGIAVAAKATFDYAKAAVKAAEESQVANQKIQQIITSMGFVGPAFNGATQRLDNFASSLSMQIGVEDEAIKQVQAFLLTFREVGPTMNEAGGLMDRATQAAFDLSAVGFGSADQAAKMLGKALNDPLLGMTALRRAAVTFTPAQQEMIKALVETGDVAAAQQIILAEVERQVGGTAAATATASSKMATTFGELQEKIGIALLPFFNELVDTLIPIVQNLEGPLSQIATTIGDTLGTVLKEIAPLLPTIAEAFAALGGAIANILGSAIQALIPVVTPLMQLFAELAQRIGPILAPILAKLGELLGAILDAVLPLLDPLANLILDLLDAASPIIEILIDGLILLVRAFQPMLTAIGNLLGPLGELIFVLFEAMAPIIEPLMPILTMLADLWGEYMVFSIGLLTVAIGYLLQAFADIAPFILNKVAVPSIRYFTIFASGIIEAADRAFGWIPGMGEKLDGARQALVTWRDNSVEAARDAANKIGAEGKRIGEELVENGRKAMLNPESLAKTRNAGFRVGEALGDGVAKGMGSKQTLINNEAERVAKQAEAAAKRALGIQSPSKVFTEIGKEIVAGFAKGVRDNAREAVTAVTDAVKQAYEKAREKLKEAQAQAQADFDDFASTVQQTVVNALDFGGALSASQAEDATTDFLGALNAQADKAQEFADRVRTLIAMGISEEALREVLAAGVDSGTAIANQLIAGGQAAITGPEGVNALVADVNAVAAALGTDTAANWYQSGVDQANQMLAAFEASFGEDGEQFKKLRRLMKGLGKRLKTKIDLDVEAPKKVIRATVRQILRDLNLVNLPDAGIDGERADGGPVFAGRRYLVGERGPEIYVPSVSGSILPNGAMTAVKSGDTFQITVNAGMGTDGAEVGRQIVDALKKYERRNGPVWASA